MMENVRIPFALTPLLTVASADQSRARAEAPGDFAAAMGLTAADGTVRTQASVRLSLSAVSGRGDYVHAMSAPVQAQLGELRSCFGQAMARSASVEGRVVFELESLPKGKARAHLVSNATGDDVMGECMQGAMGRADFKGVPQGARVYAALDLTNPSAAVRARMRRANEKDPVTILGQGLAETGGATQQGEVMFKIRGSAFARREIAGLHRDVNGRLAGLLDCRRKASRRNRTAEGTISMSLRVDEGRVTKVTTADNGVGDRNAPTCVAKWLTRAVEIGGETAELQVDVTFAR